jgi:hypothetical protein
LTVSFYLAERTAICSTYFFSCRFRGFFAESGAGLLWQMRDRAFSLENPNNSYLDSSVKKRHVDFSPSQKFPIPIPQQATTSVEVMRSDCTRIFGLLSGASSGP